MSRDKRDFYFSLLIFALAITIGIISLKLLPDFPIPGDTDKYYFPIAENLIAGRGFIDKEGLEIPKQVGPGYPLFLALIFAVFGYNLDAVRVIQFFLLGGIGVITYLISRKHLKLPIKISLPASFLIIIWPYFIIYSSLPVTEVLFIFFFLLSVHLLLEFQNNFSPKLGVLSGISLGFSALIRLQVLLLPLWLFFLWFFLLKNSKFNFKSGFIFLASFILIIVPWLIYNNVLSFETAAPFLPEDSEEAGPSYLAALEARLEKLKIAYLFWYPGAYPHGMRLAVLLERYPTLKEAILIYQALFFLVLIAAFSSLKFANQKEILLIWGAIFYFWLMDIILAPTVMPRPRYMLPLIPLIILLAAFTFSVLRSFWNQRFSGKYLTQTKDNEKERTNP